MLKINLKNERIVITFTNYRINISGVTFSIKGLTDRPNAIMNSGRWMVVDDSTISNVDIDLKMIKHHRINK